MIVPWIITVVSAFVVGMLIGYAVAKHTDPVIDVRSDTKFFRILLQHPDSGRYWHEIKIKGDSE